MAYQMASAVPRLAPKHLRLELKVMKTNSILTVLLPLGVSGFAYSQEAPLANKTIPSFNAPQGTVQIASKPAITFKAFQRQEFNHFDAKGNKTPIQPGETIKLKNGKSVKIEDYVAATNELEKRLNTLGYSLRTPVTLRVPQSQITQATQAQVDLDRIGTKFTSPVPELTGRPPLITLDGIPYDKAMAEIQSYKGTGGSGTSEETAALPNSTLNAASPPEPLLAAGVHQMSVSGGKSQNWTEGVGSFGFYFKCAMNLSGNVAVSTAATDQTSKVGNQYSQSLSEFNAAASADAGVTLFSQNIDVLHTDASYSGSDKTGNVQVSAHLSVMGASIWSDSTTASIGYSNGQTYSQPFNMGVPSVTIPCSLFSISVQAGVTGSAGVTVGYKLFTSRIDGWIKPFVTSQAYFQAGAGIDIGIASAEVGVRGSLTLLDDNMDITCNAGVYYDFTGHKFDFKDNLNITNSLNALSGNVSLYASAECLGLSTWRYDSNIFLGWLEFEQHNL